MIKKISISVSVNPQFKLAALKQDIQAIKTLIKNRKSVIITRKKDTEP